MPKGESMDATGNSAVSETSNAFTDPAGSALDPEANGPGAIPAEDAQDEMGADAQIAASQAENEEEPVDGVAIARDLLDQMMQAMGVEATVGAQRQSDGSVRLLVEGHDMGVVIGKHGST